MSKTLGQIENGVQTKSTYKKICGIGKGAYGEVFVWIDKTTCIPYGVKKLDKAKLIQYDKLHTINREIQTLNLVGNHKNIICLHDYFQDDSYIYYVTDLLPNGQLYQIMKHSHQMDLSLVKYFFGQIVNAVEYMHEQGVAHRDIKPSNIMLDAQYKPVIIDFGTSKFIH